MGFDNVNVNVCGGQSIIKALQNYNTIILKPNIVDNRNVLTQEMMSERHTKYVIRWNYSLEDATINVPKDCIIEFAGGTIDNGTIIGDNTIMIYSKPIDEVCPAERQGTFIYNTTVADEEDITSASGQLKFKDRPATDGMGRKILRKNIVDGVNTLTQSMINKANTIYVIQYDYTLGEDVSIPDNCVLEFEGGSISGAYTITGTNTGIQAGFVKIFNTDVTLAGTWNVVEAYPEWFGCVKNNENVDNSDNLQKCLCSPLRNIFLSGIFYISKPVAITYNIHLSSGGLGGITAKSDFTSVSQTTKQGATKDVYSLLYVLSDYYNLSLYNVSFNGNYKVSTLIDWLGYINGIKYERCSFSRFYEAAVIVGFSDSSTIDNCKFNYNFIGVQISGNEVDYSKPFKNTSSNPYIYFPNHVSITDCSLMFNVIGMFLCNSSDITLDNNLFGQNSLCSIYAELVGIMSIDNLYIEDDFTMGFVIEKDQNSDPQMSVIPSAALIEQLNSINEKGFRSWVGLKQTKACVNRQTLSYVGSHIRTTKGSDVEIKMGDNTLVGIDSPYFCDGGSNVLSLGITRRNLQTANVEPAYDVVVNKVYASVECRITSDMPITVKDVTYLNESCLYSVNNTDIIPIIVNKDPHLNDFKSAVKGEYYYNGSISSIPFFGFTKYAETIGCIKLFKNTYSSPQFVNSLSVDLTKLADTTYFIRYFYKVVGDASLTGLGFRIQIQYKDGTYSDVINTKVMSVPGGSAGKFGHVDFWFTKSDFNKIVSSNIKEAAKIFVSAAPSNTEHYISPLMCGECGITGEVQDILANDTWMLPDLTDVNNSKNVAVLYNLYYPRYVYWNINKWVDYDGAKADVQRSGTFASKPSASDIYIGFKYFCTDKQTTEGATNGIEIIHKGNDVWVDALGRVVS